MYWESKFCYVISDQNGPKNYPLYATYEDMGCYILSFNEAFEEENLKSPISKSTEVQIEQVWKLYFDGAFAREEPRDGFVLGPPSWEKITLSYKIEFKTSNNVSEYEALILGLKSNDKLKVIKLVVYDDLELVVNQIRVIYHTKHLILWAYRNLLSGTLWKNSLILLT